jgi:hypothetical protein
MKSGDWAVTALRALAEHDREREAPEGVETRLMAEFRKRHTTRNWKGIVLAGLAIAAAITLFLARTQPQPKQVAPLPVSPQPIAAVAAPPVPMPKASPRARPVKYRSSEQPHEIVTQFFPLLDAPPPFERGELLRVTVPASTMRKVGLPVNEDRLGERVYADVLVGQEGLARAIRFVSYQP